MKRDQSFQSGHDLFAMEQVRGVNYGGGIVINIRKNERERDK